MWQPRRTCMNHPDPPSRLLIRMVGAAPALPEPGERRRGESRRELARVMLDMRRANLSTGLVRLHDASRTGLSIICRERLFPREVIELRLPETGGLYERFRVVHMTEHACEMRVGMVVEC